MLRTRSHAQERARAHAIRCAFFCPTGRALAVWSRDESKHTTKAILSRTYKSIGPNNAFGRTQDLSTNDTHSNDDDDDEIIRLMTRARRTQYHNDNDNFFQSNERFCCVPVCKSIIALVTELSCSCKVVVVVVVVVAGDISHTQGEARTMGEQ